MTEEFKHWFTTDERTFMAHLLSLVRQSEAEGTDNEQAYIAMEEAGDVFDSIHGDGSVRSMFDRVQQALAWKARMHRCAVRALSGSKVGDLATWLNEADAALLESMGITL
jgi:hypothetical protein